jgi:PAS domain S-box-containing protein
MEDHERTKEQLISELEELRGQVAQLQDDETRIRRLLDNAPLAVTECDAEGVITEVNPAYEKMIGYPRNELVGMSVAELIQDGPQKDALAENFKQLVSEQPTPTPYHCTDITKDGRVIDVQVDWAYKRNSQGEVIGFTSIVSEITERKRAEEALRKSEARFRSLIQDSVVGMAVVMNNGEYIHRKKLLALQASLLGDVTQMEDDSLKDHSKTTSIPTDMEELGSDNADQELTLSLLGSEKYTLDQIEAALQRIEDGSYDRCEECGGQIPKSRLDAIPYAALCVQCASQQEEGHEAAKDVALSQTTAQITRGANHEREHETQRIL